MCRSVLEQLGGALIGRRDARLVGLRLRKRSSIGPVPRETASSARGCRLLRAPSFLLLHQHKRSAAFVLHLSSFVARLLASSMRSLLDSVCECAVDFEWFGGKKEMASMNEVVSE